MLPIRRLGESQLAFLKSHMVKTGHFPAFTDKGKLVKPQGKHGEDMFTSRFDKKEEALPVAALLCESAFVLLKSKRILQPSKSICATLPDNL